MDKASISTLIGLDAIIIDAENSRRQCISGLDSQSWKRSLAEVQRSPKADGTKEAEPKRLTGKGGNNPQTIGRASKSSSTIRSFSTAIVLPWGVSGNMLENENIINNKVSFYSDDIENNWIDNLCRNHTLIFKYPVNSHYYVAFQFETSLSVICSWFGAVQCSWVLHATSSIGMFENFASAQGLYSVNQYDEDGDCNDDGGLEPE